MRLRNKVAVVTGASSGIGRSIATRFIKEGATVVACGLNKGKLAGLMKSVSPSRRKRLVCFTHDLSKKEEVGSFVANVLKRVPTVDILVNSAGVFFDNNMINSSRSKYMRNVNVRALRLITLNLMPKMVRNSSIINISSIGSLIGNTYAGEYDRSKQWLNDYSVRLARKLLAHGIRVNVVCPGATNSPMRNRILDFYNQNVVRENIRKSKQIPFGRLTEPEDIAAACTFLGSDESVMVTGQILTVDGGVTLAKNFRIAYVPFITDTSAKA